MFVAELGVFGLVDNSHTIQNWRSPLAEVVFFLLSSAWIAPAEGKTMWLVPAATLVLLIPFCYASYVSEYLIMAFMVGVPDEIPHRAYPRVRRAVRNANLVTYGTMFIATAIWLLVSLPQH